MRQQLQQYVDLLFAGARGCEDIRQEILQNTLDRYDDLVAEGKAPEAAYRLAIMGIGDINEVLGSLQSASAPASPAAAPSPQEDGDSKGKKLLRALAVALYILCPVPVIVLGSIPGLDVIGVCGLLGMVAAATVMLMLGGKKDPAEESRPKNPKSELHKSIDGIIGAVGLLLYFVVSFATQAWHITWLIFPIGGAVKGLVCAILDLKEAGKYES